MTTPEALRGKITPAAKFPWIKELGYATEQGRTVYDLGRVRTVPASPPIISSLGAAVGPEKPFAAGKIGSHHTSLTSITGRTWQTTIELILLWPLEITCHANLAGMAANLTEEQVKAAEDIVSNGGIVVLHAKVPCSYHWKHYFLEIGGPNDSPPEADIILRHCPPDRVAYHFKQQYMAGILEIDFAD